MSALVLGVNGSQIYGNKGKIASLSEAGDFGYYYLNQDRTGMPSNDHAFLACLGNLRFAIPSFGNTSVYYRVNSNGWSEWKQL